MDVDPHRAGRSERHVALWLDRNRDLVAEPALYQRIARSRLGYRIAVAYPDADAQTLAVFGEMYLLQLTFDRYCGPIAGSGDHRATARAAGEAVRALIRPASVAGDGGPYQRAAAAIGARLRELFDPVTVDRVLGALEEFLWAKLWEVCVCQGGALPGLDEYLLMRPRTASAVVALELIEPAGRFVLPDEVRLDPSVRELTEAAHNVIAWTNDLRSFAWEAGHSTEPPATLPVLLALRDGGKPEDALATVAAMVDAQTREAIALIAKLRAGAGTAFGRYLDGVERFVAHPGMWFDDNPRYAPG
jgi:terpene synthase-like protein